MCGLNTFPEADQDRRTRSTTTIRASQSAHRRRCPRRERVGHALDLRIADGSYRQIARRLNIADATVQHELGRLDALNREKAERLRDLEAHRLDRLTISLQSGIRAGDPRAILAAVRIMERRAKLFGLDAPTKVAGADGEPMSIRLVHEQLKG
jgi:hypothetical protein